METIDDLRLWAMKFAYRVGVALLVNVSIGSGVILPGNMAIVPVAQAQVDEA